MALVLALCGLGTLLVSGCGGDGAAQSIPVVSTYNQDTLWTELFGSDRPRVVDIRSAADFAIKHLPYSENAPNGEGITPEGVSQAAAGDLVIVGQTQAAAALVADRVIKEGGTAKVLAGGLARWRHGLDVNDGQLKAWIEQKRKMTMIDVRTTEEYAEVHIAGSLNRPLGDLETWSAGLDKNAEYVMICGVGLRSATARDVLAKKGFTRVHNLIGGLEAWRYDLVCGG